MNVPRVQWTTRKTAAITVGGAIVVMAAASALVFGLSGNRNAAAPVPAYSHVFLVEEENHAENAIVGHAPYLDSLIAKGALATNFHAAGHPSLGNYMALTGGIFTTAGDCDSCTYNTPNLFEAMQSSGLSVKSYMEGLGTQNPLTPYPGAKGGYSNHHDPQAHYADQQGNKGIVDYTQLATDLQSSNTTPAFSFITPNVSHDMHSASIGAGDAWAKAEFPAIFNSQAWKTSPSLLIVTTDEGGSFNNNGVMTFFVSSDGSVAPGTTDGTNYTFYSLLRTIEESQGLAPFANNDAKAVAMNAMFADTGPTPTPTVSSSPTPTISPSPSATGSQPMVLSISPRNGKARTLVTLTGSGFTGATRVAFGGIAAVFTVISDTEITVTAPAGSGTVHVRVTTPAGQSPQATGNQFTY